MSKNGILINNSVNVLTVNIFYIQVIKDNSNTESILRNRPPKVIYEIVLMEVKSIKEIQIASL